GRANELRENACIIFSRKISADEKIKMLVEETANRKSTVVVSDDKEIIFMVRSLGAHPMSVAGFIGAKEKSRPRVSREEAQDIELNYSQRHRINEELKKLWLK
ncbi:MAG: NYN domain-containing protein, partial [Candidatus Omnitrophica bacterium]|nr:NYN domain-containing protein [Candidatus Omnitrophota bacterium]